MLKQRGIDCEFLCVHLEKDGDNYKSVTEPLEELGIKVITIQSKKQLSFGLLKSVKNVIKAGNYDLLHANLIHAELWFVLAKLLYGIKLKIVSTKHGFNDDFTAVHGFNPEKKLYNLHYVASLFTERFIERSFAVSEGIRKLYIGSGISKANCIETIHYGFKQKTDFATKAKPNNNPLEIIIIGRLVAYKGHEFVLKALPKVIEQFENVCLKIVGSGPYLGELEGLTASLGIKKNVVFCGYSNKVMALVHHADLMLIPSKSEGFGIVFLEAFEAKTPVIAFDVPASNEIIDSGKDGYLVKPFDVDELAERMIELLGDKAKRIEFAETAYGKLQSVFTPERMVDKTVAFYNKVID